MGNILSRIRGGGFESKCEQRLLCVKRDEEKVKSSLERRKARCARVLRKCLGYSAVVEALLVAMAAWHFRETSIKTKATWTLPCLVFPLACYIIKLLIRSLINYLDKRDVRRLSQLSAERSHILQELISRTNFNHLTRLVQEYGADPASGSSVVAATATPAGTAAPLGTAAASKAAAGTATTGEGNDPPANAPPSRAGKIPALPSGQGPGSKSPDGGALVTAGRMGPPAPEHAQPSRPSQPCQPAQPARPLLLEGTGAAVLQAGVWESASPGNGRHRSAAAGDSSNMGGSAGADASVSNAATGASMNSKGRRRSAGEQEPREGTERTGVLAMVQGTLGRLRLRDEPREAGPAAGISSGGGGGGDDEGEEATPAPSVQPDGSGSLERFLESPRDSGTPRGDAADEGNVSTSSGGQPSKRKGRGREREREREGEREVGASKRNRSGGGGGREGGGYEGDSGEVPARGHVGRGKRSPSQLAGLAYNTSPRSPGGSLQGCTSRAKMSRGHMSAEGEGDPEVASVGQSGRGLEDHEKRHWRGRRQSDASAATNREPEGDECNSNDHRVSSEGRRGTGRGRRRQQDAKGRAGEGDGDDSGIIARQPHSLGGFPGAPGGERGLVRLADAGVGQGEVLVPSRWHSVVQVMSSAADLRAALARYPRRHLASLSLGDWWDRGAGLWDGCKHLFAVAAASFVGVDTSRCMALICQSCRLHNGLCPPEDFDNMIWYCPACLHRNDNTGRARLLLAAATPTPPRGGIASRGASRRLERSESAGVAPPRGSPREAPRRVTAENSNSGSRRQATKKLKVSIPGVEPPPGREAHVDGHGAPSAAPAAGLKGHVAQPDDKNESQAHVAAARLDGRNRKGGGRGVLSSVSGGSSAHVVGVSTSSSSSHAVGTLTSSSSHGRSASPAHGRSASSPHAVDAELPGGALLGGSAAHDGSAGHQGTPSTHPEGSSLRHPAVEGACAARCRMEEELGERDESSPERCGGSPGLDALGARDASPRDGGPSIRGDDGGEGVGDGGEGGGLGPRGSVDVVGEMQGGGGSGGELEGMSAGHGDGSSGVDSVGERDPSPPRGQDDPESALLDIVGARDESSEDESVNVGGGGSPRTPLEEVEGASGRGRGSEGKRARLCSPGGGGGVDEGDGGHEGSPVRKRMVQEERMLQLETQSEKGPEGLDTSEGGKGGEGRGADGDRGDDVQGQRAKGDLAVKVHLHPLLQRPGSLAGTADDRDALAESPAASGGLLMHDKVDKGVTVVGQEYREPPGVEALDSHHNTCDKVMSHERVPKLWERGSGVEEVGNGEERERREDQGVEEVSERDVVGKVPERGLGQKALERGTRGDEGVIGFERDDGGDGDKKALARDPAGEEGEKKPFHLVGGKAKWLGAEAGLDGAKTWEEEDSRHTSSSENSSDREDDISRGDDITRWEVVAHAHEGVHGAVVTQRAVAMQT
eukprot:jgi/Mesvir1/2161/Mv16674-RA.1